MNGLTVSILFENQHAWPLRIVRVILNNNGRPQPIDDVTHAYRVSGKLLVAVK
jgi:hypothetical protein